MRCGEIHRNPMRPRSRRVHLSHLGPIATDSGERLLSQFLGGLCIAAVKAQSSNKARVLSLQESHELGRLLHLTWDPSSLIDRRTTRSHGFTFAQSKSPRGGD